MASGGFPRVIAEAGFQLTHTAFELFNADILRISWRDLLGCLTVGFSED
jgi:hypothetical protein